VNKILKLVRLKPLPFVKASSVLFMLVGFAGVLLKLFTPFPALTLVLGIGLWGFQEEIADKIRSNQGQIMQEMQSMMQDVQMEE